MAIVRAFEEALTDQCSRSSTSAKATGSRKQKKAAPPDGNNASKSAIIDEKNNEQKSKYENSTATGRGQPNAGSPAPCTPEANPFGYQPNQQSDVYQTAFAQAYTQLLAQLRAAYPATTQQPFEPSFPMPVHSPYYPQTPSMPFMSAPFPGMPTFQTPRSMSSAEGSDDGLANVLLAWYQSGYYTGRFQALQEMKLHGHH
ncbi:hypothetical protein PsorP6_009778 [Peronosclerospora sorghi]|uniref:Uncharacterized protein n=1 Tax=Peronosclerospora sorghi TaxID=230839 RepID=A0ACC0W1I4_9STRA|nr:hypothetical protein PsorP6_009778 [Peronosclerospora sorghi]